MASFASTEAAWTKSKWKQWPAMLAIDTMGGARKPPGPKVMQMTFNNRVLLTFSADLQPMFPGNWNYIITNLVSTTNHPLHPQVITISKVISNIISTFHRTNPDYILYKTLTYKKFDTLRFPFSMPFCLQCVLMVARPPTSLLPRFWSRRLACSTCGITFFPLRGYPGSWFFTQLEGICKKKNDFFSLG